MEGFSARLSALRLSPAGTIFLLCLSSAGLSVFMNNIGALALMIPVAYGVCGARGIDGALCLVHFLVWRFGAAGGEEQDDQRQAAAYATHVSRVY